MAKQILIFRRVAHLIRSCSNPNQSSWIKLPGRIKGRYQSYSDAEAYIEYKGGSIGSEEDRIAIINVGLKERRFETASQPHDENFDPSGTHIQ